jgi:hypothetical protein
MLCEWSHGNVNKPQTIKNETELHFWQFLYSLDEEHITGELWGPGEQGSGQPLSSLHALYFSRRTLILFYFI